MTDKPQNPPAKRRAKNQEKARKRFVKAAARYEKARAELDDALESHVDVDEDVARIENRHRDRAVEAAAREAEFDAALRRGD